MFQFKRNEATANSLWTMIVIPLTLMTAFTILAIMAGDNAHEALEKYMDDKPIKTHENFADIFAMLLYITTGLSYFVFLFKERRRYLLMTVIFILSVVVFGMAIATGKSGGEVVHKYDAPQYMNKAIKDGVLEHLGKHTHTHNESEEHSEHSHDEADEKVEKK
jgi:uncharacterized membrane protein